MSTILPFILHILVADGDPDGLRVAGTMQKLTGLEGLKGGAEGGVQGGVVSIARH